MLSLKQHIMVSSTETKMLFVKKQTPQDNFE